MKVVTAKVVAGVIEVPPEVTEGSSVAILTPDDTEPVSLSLAEERELDRAHAEIREGKYVDGWKLLTDLSSRTRV